MRVPLGKGDYERSFARAAALKFINRMYEQSPQNQTDQVALISRPGSTFEDEFGTGPIRATFTSPGMFGGDLFAVSGQLLFKKRLNEPAAQVEGTEVLLPSGKIRMAGAKGAGYERLFISDESNRLLMFQATGTNPEEPTAGDYTARLTVNWPSLGIGFNIPTQVFGIDNIYYVSSSQATVNTGSPDGTISKPWRVSFTVSVGPPHLVSANEFLENLSKAINASGVGGTDYTTALVQNPRVQSLGFEPYIQHVQPPLLTVANRDPGVPEPPILVSPASTGISTALEWDKSSLAGGTGGEGGAGAGITSIATPGGFNVSGVAEIASFILLVKANSQRVYFIRPGNTTIDATDFFEAESDTDNLVDIIVAGDQVWLMGEKSIEPWFLSGSLDPIASPFEPAKGQALSFGALPGTIVNHDGRIFFIGSDFNAYEIAGAITQISNPGISERIRRASGL